MELKRITDENQQIMLELLTNPLVKKTYMLPDFARQEDAIPLFRRFCTLSEDKGRFVRGIFVGNELVGVLNDVEIENGAIELGYVIHPNHWNKGYATAALKTAITQLFDLGYHTVLAGAFEENKASVRVMEKARMHRIDKTDLIEYRGAVHRCVYFRIEK